MGFSIKSHLKRVLTKVSSMNLARILPLLPIIMTIMIVFEESSSMKRAPSSEARMIVHLSLLCLTIEDCPYCVLLLIVKEYTIKR